MTTTTDTAPAGSRGPTIGGAWLVTGMVGCVFAAAMAWMITWSAAGHEPPYVAGAFWGACTLLAVLGGVYALTVVSRRRPATYGVEPLTIAERNRLAADQTATDTDELSELAA